MTDWSDLEDAYGSAAAVPDLLRQLDPDPRAQVWDELWSRVCHQSTVYSASYPVLPQLLVAARPWVPLARVMPLSLAGAIVSAPNADAMALRHYSDAVRELRDLALQTLEAPELSRSDVVYLQQAALALAGDRTWSQQLDRLLEGELEAMCPACDTELFLFVGENGFCTTTQEGIEPSRQPIVTAAPGQLQSPGNWLFGVAASRGDAELQKAILHLFGTSTCPHCGHDFPLPNAIRRVA